MFTLRMLRQIILLVAAASVLSGCAPTSFLVTPMRTRPDLRENVLRRESIWATKKIALIDVDGALQNGRQTSLLGTPGENPVSLFVEKLDRAARDRNVRAVVIRINSPGGTVTASDLMHAELQNFRKRTGKPVLAAMLDVAASGGYYLACAADRIYAHPTTITGSIGVIMLLPEFTGTMQKLGVAMNVVKSGAMKDTGSMFRTLEPEDRELFEHLVDGMYTRFVNVVVAGRPGLDEAQARELADGRVFLGPEAKELGLVDEVGDLKDAIAAAKTAAGIDHAVKIVQYARPLAYRPNVYARHDAPAVNIVNVELPDWLTGPSPQLLYLWAPGW